MSNSESSRFTTLSVPPADEAFAVNGAYLADTSPDKVNLGIGVYRTDEGRPWPLRVVERAENQLHEEHDAARHEYLAIRGDVEFLDLARDLVFASAGDKEGSDDRIASVQTVSGTGANRLGADFLAQHLRPGRVWIPEPTWSNHHAIWTFAGVARGTYPYYDVAGKCFDWVRTAQTLNEQASPGDVVVLHACAHNPTGADPSKEQWEKFAALCQAKGLIPFFDLAYQGFASGSVEEDSWAIRHFFHYQPQLEFFVAQSFSKNFGLYGQRAGALHVVTSSAGLSTGVSQAVLANLCSLVRGEYSMAPRRGSEIVKTVLRSPDMRRQWHEDLQLMSGRIKAMRQALYDRLVALQTPGTWEHILSQIGMFSYTGLSENQVFAITQRHHVYLLKSGRISISGLNESNVDYVARAIDDVVRTVI
ncbi:hypothetical protein ASPZODRAFT_63994 [Penicilliopsis zonata CBS 506.65]|uniref:Aspartate aminotransferase n=1 Tax=Penicilliopsis zonata CBS 506.65 TaxID=1073090 RepID=A0A1L9SKH7_9EURO|nr:hypothetical protein ASPZODRAFT_63994 [Penicilliopsis zonata CBS 506.65]OJJ47739.1 hypothetical protein ASPZODRAFT_63994 [Penicilliopsis zonata CBS 506.65]